MKDLAGDRGNRTNDGRNKHSAVTCTCPLAMAVAASLEVVRRIADVRSPAFGPLRCLEPANCILLLLDCLFDSPGPLTACLPPAF